MGLILVAVGGRSLHNLIAVWSPYNTTFVTEDRREQALWVTAAQRVSIRVTKGTRSQLYAHLTSLRRIHLPIPMISRWHGIPRVQCTARP